MIYGYSFVQLAILIVVVAAVIALVVVALNYFGVVIPDFVKRCFWICIVAILVILSIKFVAGLLSLRTNDLRCSNCATA